MAEGVEGPTGDSSIPELVRQTAENATRLAKLEMELAKAQLLEIKSRTILAIVLLVSACFLLSLTIIFALAMIPESLGTYWFGDSWKGWGVMAAVLLLLTIVVGGSGMMVIRRTMRRTKATIESIKNDFQTLREDAPWPIRSTKPETRST